MEHSTTRKRLATVGVSALLLAGGATAGAVLGAPVVSNAQSSESSETTDDTTTGDPSAPADEDRAAAHEERLRDVLQPLVDDGTLTAEQLDAVVAALRDAGAGPFGHGHGPGPGRGPGLDAAAEALGMTADELRGALADGSTIAEVAEAGGVDLQAVIDAMVADLETHLAEKVAEGDLTQEEADERLATAQEHITALVNGELPAGGPHRGFGPPPGFPGIPGGDDTED
jgi:hypothetical protein